MKAILSLLFVLAAAPAFAEDKAPTLKEHMINLDKMYKAVVKQINTPAQNPTSITMFQTMEKLGYECIAMLPAAFDEDGADNEKRLKEILYQKMMSQLLIMVLEGEEALQKNDNASAKAVLSKMTELKFQGHQIFKP